MSIEDVEPADGVHELVLQDLEDERTADHIGGNATLRMVRKVRAMEERLDEFERQLAEKDALIEALRKRSGRIEDLEQRVVDLELGEVDVSLPELAGVERQELLPIQRKRLDRELGEDVKPANLKRATFVWEEFHKRAIKEPKSLKLSSQQVQNILREKDLNHHRETVGRTMEMLARHTCPPDADPTNVDGKAAENLIKVSEGPNKLMLVANRDEFESHRERQVAMVHGKDINNSDDRTDVEGRKAEVREETAREIEMLAQATPVKNGESAAASIQASEASQEEVIDQLRNGE